MIHPGNGGDLKNVGWIFYDAECGMCAGTIERCQCLLLRHGLVAVPLQTPHAAERLGVTPARLMAEMHYLTASGVRLGGVDALVAIGRKFTWALPLVALLRVPGMMLVGRWLYKRVAARRYCVAGRRRPLPRRRVFLDLP